METYAHMHAALEHLKRASDWDLGLRVKAKIPGGEEIHYSDLPKADITTMNGLVQNTVYHLLANCTDTRGGRKFSLLCVSYIQHHLMWYFHTRGVPAWNGLTNAIRQEIAEFGLIEVGYDELDALIHKPNRNDADLLAFKMMF